MHSGRRDMLWRRIESTIVCAHTDQAPSDEEWEGVLDAFREISNPGAIRVLVHSDGGAPNARQRAQINGLLGKVNPPIAILTPSAIARAAATAISWFIPNLRIFRPEDIDGAMRHLGASEPSIAVLRRTLAELRTELRSSPSNFAPVR